jgi:hypothetical protein
MAKRRSESKEEAMSLKLMEKEQRDQHLKKLRDVFNEAMSGNPSEAFFVVVNENGSATTGAGGIVSPLMMGHVEGLKMSLTLEHFLKAKMREGNDEVH